MVYLGDKKYFKIKKGKRLTKNDRSEGSTPYIGAVDNNNGLADYVDKDPIFKGNSITINYNGSVAYAFYQGKAFWASDDCNVLESDYMTPSIGLFLCFIITKEKYRFNYGRKWHKNRMEVSKIRLPCLGDGTPDWKFMDSFIKLEEVSAPNNRPYHHKKVSLSDRKWELFEYKDIFNIKKGFYNKKPDTTEIGNIPFVGATEKNNGVTFLYPVETISGTRRDGGKEDNATMEKKIYSKGCVTFSNGGSIGNVFYQNLDFACAHHTNPIYIKNKIMTPFIGLFLSTLMELDKYRYSAFGRECRLDRLPKSKIKLPVDSTGNPDWKFMEYYIKSLPYSSNLKEDKEQPAADKQIFDGLISRASTPV